MFRVLVALSLCLLPVANLYAAQSTITESEGYACMGDDKSRKQTEHAAIAHAKRKAAETALTYIQSETHIKDMELEKDIASAYSNATVKIIRELEKSWYKEPSSGDCHRIRVQAEVVPDEKAAVKASGRIIEDPSAPLNVKVWTGKTEYKSGEKIKIYVKGNKPFYARVIYKDTKGAMLQLLPNPYRQENYFNGGAVYEIPSGNDRFDLEVSPPFGEENIMVYAGTGPLGEIDVKADGGVYLIKTVPDDIKTRTRGIKLPEKNGRSGPTASEFYEDTLSVKTLR